MANSLKSISLVAKAFVRAYVEIQKGTTVRTTKILHLMTSKILKLHLAVGQMRVVKVKIIDRNLPLNYFFKLNVAI